MINEPASLLDDGQHGDQRVVPLDADPMDDEGLRDTLRAAVRTVLHIESEIFVVDDNLPNIGQNDVVLLHPQTHLLAVFRGQLSLNSEAAYEQLDTLLKPQDLLPIFRRDNNQDVVFVTQGRFVPAEGGVGLNIILFALTVLSVLYVGADKAISEIGWDNPVRAEQLRENIVGNIWRGWPYALSIILILGAHELGHYFMSRRHKLAASLPYFIPFPFSPFGTMGAAIRLREPLRNRKMLLDVGAAGPLAGLIFALPILFIGLATSPVRTITGDGFVEGNSIVYALAKIITFGSFLPDGTRDVYVNQLAWAGWTGLFVTGLNLLPLGQLDGGHILYSLAGERARILYYPALLGIIALSIVGDGTFVLLLILLLLLGRIYAKPLDDITPLDNRRRAVAVLALVIFVLVFVPLPLQRFSAAPRHENESISVMLSVMTLWMLSRRVDLSRLIHGLQRRTRLL